VSVLLSKSFLGLNIHRSHYFGGHIGHSTIRVLQVYRIYRCFCTDAPKACASFTSYKSSLQVCVNGKMQKVL